MASLRDQFQHFYAPGEDAIATAIQTGLVTPDTNVLLNLYRFQAGARDELFGALEKVGERLWIPYQVGLEFQRNRFNVMAEQEAYFSKVQKEFDDAIESLCKKVREFAGARFAIAVPNVAQTEDSIRMVQRLITGYVTEAEKANEVNLKDHASDKVLARIESLLGDRVGGPMEPRELEEAKKEAKRRIEAKIPPGYKDKDKPDPTGDYLIFKQLMTEAKERKLPVVLITDDRKEDWYRREQGLTLGARWELREQMMAEAGVPFLVMTTETFLLYAEKYLNAAVSPETVDQAKELPELLDPRNSPALSAQALADLYRGRLDVARSPAGREFLARLLLAETVKNLPDDDQAKREALTELVRVLPTGSESEMDTAAKYITGFLVSNQTTREEASQSLAWLLAWIAKRKNSPGEPPTEG